MSYTEEGSFDIDLSEIAAVGYLKRSDIFHGSLLNMILRTSIRVTHISGDKIFRTRTLPDMSQAAILKSSTPSTPTPGTSASDALAPLFQDDPRDSTDRTSAEKPRIPPSLSVPPLASTSGVSLTTSAASLFQDTDTFNPVNTPNSVLMNSIPNPEIAQREVFEQIYQERVRDAWPEQVACSRVDASEVVNEIYASVCKADGIGLPMGVRREPPARDARLESNEGLQAGPVTQMLLTRKPSGRSPHLSVRSNSMGEMSDKRLRSNSLVGS